MSRLSDVTTGPKVMDRSRAQQPSSDRACRIPNHIAGSGKDGPTSQISRPGSQQNRTGPWRRQVRDGALAAEVTAVTECCVWPYENGERVMSRPTARFANLRSKFPEDPAEHHAAMRLGSFE